VKINKDLTATADGALLYDSAGGEPLAIRLMGTGQKWKQYTWYRKVPESGKLSLTLALTGLGTVYFDDLKIEPLQPGTVEMPPEEERTLRSPKPKEEDEKKPRRKDPTATSPDEPPSNGDGAVQPASYRRR
jgi:hypothetical protein